MESDYKLYSELEKYEIINVNDGEKYNYLSNNDIIIDEDGNFKFLIITQNNSKFNFFGNNEFMEIPWEYVKKVGTRTIIIDIDDSMIKKGRL